MNTQRMKQHNNRVKGAKVKNINKKECLRVNMSATCSQQNIVISCLCPEILQFPLLRFSSDVRFLKCCQHLLLEGFHVEHSG